MGQVRDTQEMLNRTFDNAASAFRTTATGIAGNINRTRGTGSGAIAVSHTADADERLVSVTVKFSAAPTTSENLTVTFNSAGGAAYDTELLRRDPSAQSDVSVVFIPDESFYLQNGDAVDVAFNNTDARTYGIEITTEDI